MVVSDPPPSPPGAPISFFPTSSLLLTSPRWYTLPFFPFSSVSLPPPFLLLLPLNSRSCTKARPSFTGALGAKEHGGQSTCVVEAREWSIVEQKGAAGVSSRLLALYWARFPTASQLLWGIGRMCTTGMKSKRGPCLRIHGPMEGGHISPCLQRVFLDAEGWVLSIKR